MHRRLIVPVAIGIAVVAAMVAAVVYVQRGAHIELRGAILKVRTQAMDENSSVAVVDFRFVNPADYAFVVRRVDVLLEDAAGKTHEGSVISDADAQRLFQFYPLLGQKFNQSLLIRTKIAPHQSMDRMIGARFELPEPRLQARRKLTVRVEDVDGAVSDITEERPK